jgi:propanediol dehydratase small subunit
MDTKNIYTATGKKLEQLTMEAVLKDELSTDDFMISAATLNAQATAAEKAGYGHLASNLRRAAELTRINNEQILEIYDTLRPGRTSYDRLITLAHSLETTLDAPLTAQLVREAAEAYIRRDIIKSSDIELDR